MSKPKKLLVVISVLTVAVIAMPAYRLVEWFGAYPVQYLHVGRPSYSKARSVADSFMAKAVDAPWDYANGSFILDFDGTSTGAPTWVFRYHNPKTGQESSRIYVRIPEYQVYHTAIGLDQLPLHGSLPR
jgi:hypothetical protein